MNKTTSILIILTAFLLAGCSKNDDFEMDNIKMSTVLSIMVKDGKAGMTTLVNDNYNVTTEYLIDNTKTDAQALQAFMPKGSFYRTTIDNYYLASTLYKNNEGTIVEYKFPRIYSFEPGNQFIYFKNGERFAMDTLALGYFHSVDAAENEVFAGFFGTREIYINGSYLLPAKAFYREGTGKITVLPMPDKNLNFNGVSCVHRSGNNIYVGGLMDFPMYWKNKEIVQLNEKYGEVNQIFTVGNDVYAVGFYNKANSKTTGHTACYWKNGLLTELEDNAVGYSIFIDGNDIYVGGAVGRFDAEYKACYWKNGKRVLLPV